MKIHCAPVCQTCEQLSDETRCPYEKETMPDAWKADDLNHLFTNLTTMATFKQYEPQVLSRPSYLTGDTNETANYTLGPWVVVLDNVVTANEAERLIELGHVEGFQRSAVVDGTANGTVYNGRTSSNAWCLFKCYNDTMAQSALARVSEIVNISERNSEYWQLLQYQEGEFYENHHDYIPSQKIRQQGIRILTVYLYLNDVEEGGGTHFSQLNITVLPKRGRALIWPSVLDKDPNEMDPRTFHEALPVIKGIKYGANAWIHMRDFKGPLHKGCITG
jgi:prolyl 4-hydroxylase